MRTAWPALRLILLVDGLVFLAAALMNFGVHLLVFSFAAPIWQAGTGEAVIAAVLLAAAFSARRGVAWTGFWLSALGIAFGLSSRAVVGAARSIHLLLVPLAAVLLGLLLASRGHKAGRA